MNLACFENLLDEKASKLFLSLNVPSRIRDSVPRQRSRAVICRFPSLARPASPRFTLGPSSLTTTSPRDHRNSFTRRYTWDHGDSVFSFRKLAHSSHHFSSDGVVLLLEPLSRKIAFGREIGQEQRHEAGHTILTPNKAHRICHHGIPSYTLLGDHCCHEESSQKKSLWFATFPAPFPCLSC